MNMYVHLDKPLMHHRRHYRRSTLTTASWEATASAAGVVSKTASDEHRRRTNIIPAVAFGYLERLLYIGDTGKFYEEEARLRSLSNVLNQAGFESYLYEDFADELFTLIRSIANAITEGNGDEVLMNAFNDESIQNYVITHFKVRSCVYLPSMDALTRASDSHCSLDEDAPRELLGLHDRPDGRSVLQRAHHAYGQRDRPPWAQCSQGCDPEPCLPRSGGHLSRPQRG
jgi:hypothetical protein